MSTTSGERDTFELLYTRLTDAMRSARPAPFSKPVTVAEIYQELVPYRLVRDEIGFAMNADYEHVLLRLLAGEGARVRLDPVSAREAIQRELRSANPNVSIYREYAACDVWVSDPVTGARPPEVAPEVVPEVVPEVAPEPPREAVRVPDASAGTASCAYCDSALPQHRPVRFCPYCGADQTTQPCADCGEPVEPGWLYCAACGVTRAES